MLKFVKDHIYIYINSLIVASCYFYKH